MVQICSIFNLLIHFQEEIERLRKEGSKHLQEEMEYVTKLVREGLTCKTEETDDTTKYRIKIKWKSEQNDVNNGGYTKDLLEKFLTKVRSCRNINYKT